MNKGNVREGVDGTVIGRWNTVMLYLHRHTDRHTAQYNDLIA